MGLGQMLLTILAIAMLGTLMLTVNTNTMDSGEAIEQSEYRIMATSLGISMLERANGLSFDENTISAEDNARIMERSRAANVLTYYDVGNSVIAGFDPVKEIRWLGKKNICEFHMKENGSLLGKGKVDFKRVREAIDEIGYEGWMQIEGAVPSGGKMVDAYIANNKFLRGIFA